MGSVTKSSDFAASILDNLVGTKVTTFYDIDPPQELSPSAISPATSGIPASVASLPAESPHGIFPPAISPSAGSPTAASPPASHTTTSRTTISHMTSHPTTASTATAATTATTTIFSASGSPLPGICCTWIITEKHSERAAYRTRQQVERGTGTPKTVGLFLCHLEDDPAQLAFMRVYHQIPITGTEYATPATRAQQVGPDEILGEREALKLLRRQGCSAVPRFLGYNEKIQEGRDLVPGGYVKYLVWEKVPGESLTEEFFWSLDRPKRDDIRARFRVAYE
ncbi:hypothetical protein PoHVEF18_006207 [Penicillium ochrochloron]